MHFVVAPRGHGEVEGSAIALIWRVGAFGDFSEELGHMKEAWEL